jgi:hypothetical protein
VSQAAINAVAASSQVGPGGKAPNAFFVYAKSMVVPLILVPVLLVLITSGVLTDLGFKLGDALTSVIQKGG